jgi:glycosyltransferase involved in cell wall biosynthesis
LYEPFGLTVLEAAISRCALVLSDIPTFRELWDGAALFVDPRKPADLHAALEYLTRDGEERTLLQKRAACRAQGYSLQSMVDRYSDLYQALAGKAPVGCIPFQSHPIEAVP